MRKPRLFIAEALRQGDIITLEPDRAHYLLNVLRLCEGQYVRVFNDSGAEFEARLITADRHRAELAIGEATEKNSESSLRITLVLALTRGRGMDYAIQKAVELGVYEIMPVVTEFGSAGPAPERLQNKMAHWRGIIISASEQCGRNRLAILHEPRPFARGIGHNGPATRLIFHPGHAVAMPEAMPEDRSLALILGPEGGFSAAEIELARRRHCRLSGLGPRILRAETAVVTAITLAQQLWGDLAATGPRRSNRPGGSQAP